jgi:hypothetical protein
MGESLANRYLAHLGLVRERPARAYLDRLIASHQRRIPFETLSKIVDAERLADSPCPLPNIEEHVERMIARSAGGTCWTLARSFHWLLREIGFDAHFMYMEPGHVCVRVELERPYYADVGYAAPLFRAYPLNESFVLDTPQERFEYAVGEGCVAVARQPGPTKTLDPTPRSFGEFADRVATANRWTPQSFLTRLQVHGCVGGVPTRLLGGVLQRFARGGVEERSLTDRETIHWISEGFGIDPELYHAAREIRARRMREHGLAEHAPHGGQPPPAAMHTSTQEQP